MIQKAMLKSALVGLMTSLVISCSSSCKKFDWEPDVYSADIEKQHLINSKGSTVGFNQPRMEEMTCLPPENIAELISEIERIGRKEKLLKNFLRTYPKLNPKQP